MRAFIFLTLCFTTLAMADENVWSQTFWNWGSGYTTQAAVNDAVEQSKPTVQTLQAKCEESFGDVWTNRQSGTCTKSDDPMFCKRTCYLCPVYTTANCQVETSGDFKPGANVEVTSDASLYTGSTKVGEVKKGEKYTIVRLKNGWVALKGGDGVQLPGWIQRRYLKISQP